MSTKKASEIIKASRIDKGKMQPEHDKNSVIEAEYTKIIVDLFEALADLYQSKCEYAGLVIYDQDGNYSRMLDKWRRKLWEAELCREDVRRGLKHLEEQNRDAARTGNEIWPCDYATFIGHCKKQKEREERKDWKRLPAPTMSLEERKAAMKKLRGELKL